MHSAAFIYDRLLIPKSVLPAMDACGADTLASLMRTSLQACLIVAALMVSACSNEPPPRERLGKEGRYYGGVFNANESQSLRGLFPLGITQAASQRIAAQVYEGLVAFDQNDLSLVPALANSWSVDATGTVYTFSLRKGVRFHDDPCFPDGKGRLVTAEDVIMCFKELCTYKNTNQMFWLVQDRIVGADEHYEATRTGVAPKDIEGIQLVDDHTVRFTLTAPWPGFLQALAHQGTWVYPEELTAYYKDAALWRMVGTGPFRLKTFKEGEVLILERNPDYWGEDEYGNQLPFLDAVRITFVQDKKRELDEFEKGNLSMVYELPVDRTDVLRTFSDGRFQVQDVPAFTTQFYGINARLEPFTDVRVRRAFSMVIDRLFLVDSVLMGLGYPAIRGVVPPGFAGYPYDTIPETRFDPVAARALLAEAGFPNGSGLPTIHLQVNRGAGYVEVATSVQAMLESHLGARVVTSLLPLDQHYQRIEQGRSLFWREGWIADHPDPENFLALFHGKQVPADTALPSTLNSTRYNEPRFDALFMEAQRTTDVAARLQLLAQAERVLMGDAVVIPLYHERSVRLLQNWVQELPINGLEYRLLRGVWFDPKQRKGA